MFKGISHIGVVVKDLDEAISTYARAFQSSPPPVQILPDAGMRGALFPIGDLILELMEPIGEGVIARFLEKHGPGVHHICIEVEDLEAALQHLQNTGVELIDKQGRPGVEGEVAFLHPKPLQGVLIELVDKKGKAGGNEAALDQEQAKWTSI